MKFSSYSFGKLLSSAITAYKMGHYIEADSQLNKALAINKDDFEATFWKIRVAVMQKNYETAVSLISACKELKVASKMNELFVPWEDFCSDQIYEPWNNELALINLNNTTDELLQYYQHHRSFSIGDLLRVILLYYGVAFIILGTLQWLKVKSFLVVGGNLFDILFLPIICMCYYRKATLNSNIYIAFQFTIKKIRELFMSKQFRKLCFFFIVLMVMSHLNSVRFLGSPPLVNNITDSFLKVMITAPISEEILFRGYLYGYLKKYGKFISWGIVMTIFSLAHYMTPSLWHAIFSFIALSVYDKEKTILAPICIHLLNNGTIYLLAKFGY